MKRIGTVALVAALLIATAVIVATRRRQAPAPATETSRSISPPDSPSNEAALARLRGIPFYRAILSGRALRSATFDRNGALRVEIDVRAIAESRVAAAGLGAVVDLLPALATGTIAPDGQHESWVFDGPCALFDLLDRRVVPGGPSPAQNSVPGAPSSLVRAHLLPSRLADPEWGGAAFAPWRERAGFVEKFLGRPFRAELAEDVAGPAVFALYETSDPNAPEAILAVELRRSDRLSGMLDMLFGLGALAERATVRRYRGVATGAFSAPSQGPGLALAVDGPLLLVATSRALLESAIDARRSRSRREEIPTSAGEAEASWNAVSTSAFVAHGWTRLARLPDPPVALPETTAASLWPEGKSAWRLEGRGAAPAITADPLLPFLRTAFATRQGAGD